MSRAVLIAVLGFAAGLGGCVATVRPPTVRGFAVTYTSPPPFIETYPHVVSGGVDAYLVGNVWYTWTPDGWAYFREVPPQLRSYGYGGYPGGTPRGVREAPPAPRTPAGPPPAIRVR